MSLTLLPHDPNEFAASKANQACSACRKQKRKCDKSFPACSLCARMGRPCDYTDAQQPPPTTEDIAALQMKLIELESRLNSGHGASSAGSSGMPDSASTNTTYAQQPPPQTAREALWQGGMSHFPSVLFLDFDAFRWLSMAVPKPSVEIPAV
jgi:hypothetical protein